MKKRVFILIVSVILLLSGCNVLNSMISDSYSEGSAGTGSERKLVGLTIPTKTLSRWSSDTDSIKPGLENLGYMVDLQYADNDPYIQRTQIENQIEKGCDILVITPVDSGALGETLEKAKEAGIPVIAYDKLLTNTDKCDYYVTFDNYGAGMMQGQYIVYKLGLGSGETGSFTLECFAGDPWDNNAKLFYQGAMEVLQPYIDSGKLAVVSGQTTWPDQVAIMNWKSEEAQDRMDNLLTAFYTDKNIDAVLSPNDSISQGIAVSLKNLGYGTNEKPFPILTGQDCDTINIGQIIRGEQSMSVFRDKRLIMSRAIEMVDALLSGREVQVNAVYSNGVIDVPSYNCGIKLVDANNWKQVLVDSGYYREDDIPMD